MSAPTFPLPLAASSASAKPVTLALTETPDPDNPIVGDLHLDRGQIHFLSGVKAIRQKAVTRSKMFQGEWYLDVDDGIPYYQQILGDKGRSRERVLNVFRKMLLSIPNVAKVTKLDLVVITKTRQGVVNYEVTTTDGEIVPGSFTPFYFPGAK